MTNAASPAGWWRETVEIRRKKSVLGFAHYTFLGRLEAAGPEGLSAFYRAQKQRFFRLEKPWQKR
jgi:hypothetical protein